MVVVTGGRNCGKTARLMKEVERLKRKGVHVVLVSSKDKPQELSGISRVQGYCLQAAEAEILY